ncbi:MAG: hypothetical protein WCW02_03710 [Candidatus Buchananbacteria bacterium]
MKKIKFILSLILVLLVAGLLLWRFMLEPKIPKLVINTNQGAIEINLPKSVGQKISTEPQREDYSLKQTDTYEIFAYAFGGDQSFLISLKQYSAVVRTEAETSFLNSLGITKSAACKLAVLESFTGLPELAGINYGLSFCPDSLPLN